MYLELFIEKITEKCTKRRISGSDFTWLYAVYKQQKAPDDKYEKYNKKSKRDFVKTLISQVVKDKDSPIWHTYIIQNYFLYWMLM